MDDHHLNYITKLKKRKEKNLVPFIYQLDIPLARAIMINGSQYTYIYI
jgi:hypothetical protein